MTDFRLIGALAERNDNKIVLLVMDGLGGLPMQPGGPTELEAARTPNLDRLAGEATLGLSVAVGPGITPGSGPAHLALFGYDPLVYDIGRGVLEALGIGFDLRPEDVAARGNFCTLDDNGLISDRRAGRIKSEAAAALVQRLRAIRLPDVQVFVEPVKEHRFALVLRPQTGDSLSPAVADTDPQLVGHAPLPARALQPEAERTAALINQWIAQAREILKDERPANGLTLRGFAKDPGLPKFPEVYKLRAAAIAIYPMYRGVAKLIGMDVLDPGQTLADEVARVREAWERYDFFFVHIKPTDSRGEDGDFAAKVRVIEEVDALIPDLLALGPTVLIVTGDHATPAKLRSHSWHPVPTLLWSPNARPDGAPSFGERTCRTGGLGIFPATDLMPLALGHALRLARYGA
jgi:2,3-bisphosphoglycerate-independent phosphoglycerate mutase